MALVPSVDIGGVKYLELTPFQRPKLVIIPRQASSSIDLGIPCGASYESHAQGNNAQRSHPATKTPRVPGNETKQALHYKPSSYRFRHTAAQNRSRTSLGGGGGVLGSICARKGNMCMMVCDMRWADDALEAEAGRL